MSDHYHVFYRYRDRSLHKYEISILQLETCSRNGYASIIEARIFLGATEKAKFSIKFTKECILTLNIEIGQFENILWNENYSALLYFFIQEILFDNKVEELDRKEFMFSADSTYAKNVFKNSKGKLDYRIDPKKLAQINRFTRELILRESYELTSSNTRFSLGGLIEKCHHFPHLIEGNFETLKSRGFIEVNEIYKPPIRLSYKGIVFVEDNYLLSAFNDKFFLIAACQDDIKWLYKEVYKPIIEDELHFKLIFQEENEPKDTIHDEIWENIRNCKLIICDLTHHRPNCFIEFGYALALNRPIICIIEEKEGKNKKGRLKLPFDCSNKNFTFWRHDWTKNAENYRPEILEFKENLKKRIEQRLALIDAQSEI